MSLRQTHDPKEQPGSPASLPDLWVEKLRACLFLGNEVKMKLDPGYGFHFICVWAKEVPTNEVLLQWSKNFTYSSLHLKKFHQIGEKDSWAGTESHNVRKLTQTHYMAHLKVGV